METEQTIESDDKVETDRDFEQSIESVEDECFESNESEIDPLFSEFVGMSKHIQCIAHKLQLVLKDVFESNQSMLDLKRVSLKVIN